ncbi:TnpV protein (plasmid) [Nitratidesulfovibrio vulgaris]|jgi:hypothetical protein|nr:TnpV protein [Nitratidesulfovibrio vulgaris]WCB48090.1 TnpV protein [Nitratidesulfovibrio vulgaris]
MTSITLHPMDADPSPEMIGRYAAMGHRTLADWNPILLQRMEQEKSLVPFLLELQEKAEERVSELTSLLARDARNKAGTSYQEILQAEEMARMEAERMVVEELMRPLVPERES